MSLVVRLGDTGRAVKPALERIAGLRMVAASGSRQPQLRLYLAKTSAQQGRVCDHVFSAFLTQADNALVLLESRRLRPWESHNGRRGGFYVRGISKAKPDKGIRFICT